MKERIKDDFRNYYDIIRKIGEGDFSKVYEVKMKNMDEKRAIKVYDIFYLETDYQMKYLRDDIDLSIYLNAFYKEVVARKIMGDNDNEKDNILKYYEYFHNEKELAIVMELCDCNISDLIKHRYKGFKLKEIKDILNQINISLKKMIENRIVQNYILLENILIKFKNKERTNYIVKLDFYYEMESIKTPKGRDIKSIFKAPEIVFGKSHIDIDKCYLWSLELLIYYLYFDEIPFNGTKIAIYHQIEKLGINHFKKTENSDLDNLIRGLLRKDPKERLSIMEYFEHPFFIKNNHKKSIEDENICSQNNENIHKQILDDKKFKEINEKNNELMQQLNNEKNKNEKLNKKISELENEIKNEKSKNKDLEEEIKQLRKKINNLKLESENNRKFLENLDIKDYCKIILEKDKEINELKNKLSRFPFILNEGEKLISVNFQSLNESLSYIVICKNTDIFNTIEKKLYEEYPEYLESENYFEIKGKKINKYKSLEKNKIHNNDIIIINQIFD